MILWLVFHRQNLNLLRDLVGSSVGSDHMKSYFLIPPIYLSICRKSDTTVPASISSELLTGILGEISWGNARSFTGEIFASYAVTVAMS